MWSAPASLASTHFLISAGMTWRHRRVELVARAVEVGRHQVDDVLAVLRPVGLDLDELGQLGDAVGGVGLLGVALPERVLVNGTGVNFGYEQIVPDHHRLRRARQPGLVEDVGAHEQVVEVEVGRPGLLAPMPPTRAARWIDQVGLDVGEQAARRRRRGAGRTRRCRARRPAAALDGAAAARAPPDRGSPPAGDQHARSAQAVGHGGHRRTERYRRRVVPRQHLDVRDHSRRCGSPSPSSSAGTACPGAPRPRSSTRCDALAGRADVELVGVAARHGHPPAGAVRPADPGRAPAACPACRCTRPGTGCAGRGRAGDRPGRRRPRHRRRRPAPPGAAGRDRARPGLPPRPPEHHPPRARGSSGGPSSWPGATPTWCCCPSQATLEDCAAAGFDRARLRLCRGASTPRRSPPHDVDGGARPAYGLDRALRAVGRHPRAPQEPARRCSRRSPGSPAPATSTLVARRPDGLERGPATRLARLGRRTCAALGFVDPTPIWPPSTPGPRCSASRACCEGFGLPVLEAMAQGAPVVTSAGTATEEVVAGDAGGASTRRDADAHRRGPGRRPRRRRPRPTAGRRAPAGPGPPSSTWDGHRGG